MFLRELSALVVSLKGVGKVSSGILSSAGIVTVAHLLTHIPRSYEDRQTPIPLASARSGGTANTVITVVAHEYIGHGKNAILKIVVEDETAAASLVCFGRNFLRGTLVPGNRFFLFGQFTYKFGELQASVFETEPYNETPSAFGRILPVYPLHGSLTQGFFRKVIESALNLYAVEIENGLPVKICKKHGLMSKSRAISSLHFPSEPGDAEHAKKTLCFEELYYLQLTMKRRAQKVKGETRNPRKIQGDLAKKLGERLPFALTKDQQKVLAEIKKDLQQGAPMLRLLQGDVGCGKTLIALFSALYKIELGEQVAIMAPTELLARQHAESAAQMLEPLGIRIALLSGTVTAKARKQLLSALVSGEIDILLGTHALFSADVRFKNLRLVIVDEQHRFGVLQRIALTEKGESVDSSPPDLLLMTATPIPRSLALTVFGDLDVSTIKTMPPGRKPVETHLARMGNESKVYKWVHREVAAGRQAYFVYPLIEQSEKLALKDAESMFHDLNARVFPHLRLALLHSRVPEDQKRDTMALFANGEVDILVATSVIEVGVNIPNATCMVVEHAERFGLSALHQLRGRVGRAGHQSYAFLIYGEGLSDDGRNRLMAMKETTDGFLIAEKDLEIRGPGELTGTRQSGRLNFTFADIVRDIDLLKEARDDVEQLLQTDPGLIEKENRMVRAVLNRAPPFAEETAGGE
jgi:ATP-dependent DNA helicase RecG